MRSRWKTWSPTTERLAEHIRTNVAGTFHVSGTCRMAKIRRGGGLGRPRARHRGLRVADASVMPTVPRANTNIPTIMIAEKLAATIGPLDARRRRRAAMKKMTSTGGLP
jgi:5-(hydroxymethyl)furfural/furfural oxidase